jgi:hypothetical protein
MLLKIEIRKVLCVVLQLAHSVNQPLREMRYRPALDDLEAERRTNQ